MIASAYIKDGNMCLYNEDRRYTDLGGVMYVLGKPLLNFVCYERERFDESFALFVEAFETPGATYSWESESFRAEMKPLMTETQINEPYIFFYQRAFLNAVYNGQPPRKACRELTDDFRQTVAFAEMTIGNLLALRERFPDVQSPLEYLYLLDAMTERDFGEKYFLEQPFKAFYSVTKPPEVVELYEIDWVRDLFRFEMIKMIENNIYIKKCKNCERFFIPSRRANAEYCERVFGETTRKCSEIGAMLRYERKVAENPVWEVYKRNYRRQNSRTRTKKMSQTEFLQWSEQAAQKRDECLAGSLPFDDYVAWLEQGRIRKQRVSKQQGES